MIRPQSENFWYSESEFEIMKRTLESAKILGADGFVFGILNKIPEDGKQHALSWVDVSRNKQLVQLAGGKPCTFHRAFDCIPESCWDAAFSQITECGFAAILTNGGPSSDKAIDCVDKLATLASKQDHLFRQLARTGIPVPDIIVGGGVRSTNIQALLKGTNAHVFHSSALKTSSEVVEKKEVEKLRESLMMLRRSPEGQYSIG
ncbi:Copper homeostasis protein CutC [Penicillium macrosclerotiorum]|uniref:Copper homeostasis protein CutC n=1 Tax=Penicillium macrosclerotiorum TaxID=303699 RepID=UPI00254812C2|nr:Copper homeostasis protein CutC [Penicillium macrosclerotiorum]KAJ5690890.1 Copper homeostasis protein CutC [Penicillium macrosclerotiorum]